VLREVTPVTFRNTPYKISHFFCSKPLRKYTTSRNLAYPFWRNVNENRTYFPRTRRRVLPSALRDASSTKDEKELEVLEKAIDELAEIIGHDVAMPILEEEIARQQAARREAEAERDELLAQMETLMKEDLE
jgi:hypothetical protein